VNRTQVGAAPRPAHIRPASHADRDALRAFLAGLSPRTSYLRFFMGGSPSGPSMLAVLTGSRPGTDAVVAVRGDVIVGHAMAVCAPGPGGALAADIGVVVADAWQGRGVGSALLRAVAALARARGATTLLMDVLAENHLVLGMIRGHWPGVPRSRSGPYIAVSVPIPAPVPVSVTLPASAPRPVAAPAATGVPAPAAVPVPAAETGSRPADDFPGSGPSYLEAAHRVAG
jgi:GNAT superfamily N-acetyltransferase